MADLLTAAQMRAIEQAAIESGAVTGLELMERAGAGVVEAVIEQWPELGEGSHRAVVLCGPGNNGGDGFVVARLLKERGWEVETFHYGDPSRLPPDARVNYERWLELGEVHGPLADDNAFVGEPLVVDALFGTGLARPLSGVYRDAVDRMLRCNAPERMVAVDIASGISADSGLDLAGMLDGAAHGFGLTVTFHGAKLGHHLGTGARITKKLSICSIGLPIQRVSREERRSRVHLSFETRMTAKYEDECKFDHGHALVLSGGPGKGGAARLAGRGALRIGAGLVTLACPPEAVTENAAQLNAIMLKPVADAGAVKDLLKDTRMNAICVGPGFGVSPREAEIVEAILRAKRPTVVDADALSLIARVPQLFAMLHEACVLTPHAGEFARLFPDISEALAKPAMRGPAYSKVDATRAAAARAGCVVLFKGQDTVIAAPDGQCSINSAAYERAAPWLATAGSGDVLAGFITGLLARSFNPKEAAESGAWLHTECALAFGPGLIAEDIPEMLPKVLRGLEA